MPKKTRQEKILAQLKRLQQQQNTVANPQAVQTEQKSNAGQPEFKIVTTLKSLETKENSALTPINTKLMDYTYAYKDLRKTLLFVTIAIIFEIILSRVI